MYIPRRENAHAAGAVIRMPVSAPAQTVLPAWRPTSRLGDSLFRWQCDDPEIIPRGPPLGRIMVSTLGKIGQSSGIGEWRSRGPSTEEVRQTLSGEGPDRSPIPSAE